MPIYDRGETLQAGTVPYSDRYIETAMKGQKADKAAIRKQALQEIAQDYASRGLTGSGVAQLAGAQARQGFADQDTAFRQGLGMKAAMLGEENRRRLENRGWNVEDRNWRAEQERLQHERDLREADQEAQGGMWGNILGTAGSIVGSIYGGPAGGAIGGAAGRRAGGMVGGGNTNRARYGGGTWTGKRPDSSQLQGWGG